MLSMQADCSEPVLHSVKAPFNHGGSLRAVLLIMFGMQNDIPHELKQEIKHTIQVCHENFANTFC